MWTFISANYKWICAGIYAVILLLIIFLKKRYKVIEVLKVVIQEILPEAINMAEEKFGAGNGDKKKEYVLSLVFSLLAKEYDIDEIVIIEKYRPYIERQLENILSTPQKK